MSEISDPMYLGRAVRSAGRHAHYRRVRWAHVMEVFAVGSTSAQELCRRFHVDPDEQVGGCHECKQNYICVYCSPDHDDDLETDWGEG